MAILGMGGNEAFYPAEYNVGNQSQPLLPNIKQRHQRALLKTVKHHHDFIKDCGGYGKLLDIGCNMGHFLYGMQQFGWQEIYGLEPSEAAAQYAEKSLGISIWRNLFPDIIGLPQQHFDVITMFHVFEHLHNPVEALATLHTLLAPGGLCLINIPNPNCLERRVFGEKWCGFEVPRHYFTYPPDTFKQLAHENGFTVIADRYIDHPLGSTLLSIRFALSDTNWLKWWLPVERLLSIGLIGKTLNPLFYILQKFGWGTSRAYVLKRASEL